MKEMEFNILRINESEHREESENIAKPPGDYCAIENNASLGRTTAMVKRENHNYLDLQRTNDNVPKPSYDNVPVPKSRNDNVRLPKSSNDNVQVPKLSNDNVQMPKLSNDNVQVPQRKRTFTTSVKQHMDCIMLSLIGVLFVAVIALAVVVAMLKIADANHHQEKGTELGFYVYTAKPDTGKNTTLKFAYKLYNSENLFDMSSGEFVCKQAGLYYFILSIIPDTNNGTEDAHCYFYKNDVKSGLAAWYDNVNNQGSFLPVASTISHRLLLGDKISIKDCETSRAYAYVSTFTGFLVYADD